MAKEAIPEVDLSSVIHLAESLWGQRSEDPEQASVVIVGLGVNVQGVLEKLEKEMRKETRDRFPRKVRSGTYPRIDRVVGPVSIVCKTDPDKEDTPPSTQTITINWSKGSDRWSLGIILEPKKFKLVEVTNQDQTASFVPEKSTQS